MSGSFGGGTYEVQAVQDAAKPRYWVLTATGTHGLSQRRVEVGVKVRKNPGYIFGAFGRERVWS